jgi:hypothetical protein
MNESIDDYWDICTSHGTIVAPKQFRATCQAIRRDTFSPVGPEHVGEGKSMDAADNAARRAAIAYLRKIGVPKGWKG